MKIETPWGEATLNMSKIKHYYCHVDVWKQDFNIIIAYSTGSEKDDQITALCNSFDDMIRTCKRLHDELTLNFDMREL